MTVQQKPDGRWYVIYKKGRNILEPTKTKEYFSRDEVARKKSSRYKQEGKQTTFSGVNGQS